jgi:hypothetical protein
MPVEKTFSFAFWIGDIVYHASDPSYGWGVVTAVQISPNGYQYFVDFGPELGESFCSGCTLRPKDTFGDALAEFRKYQDQEDID